MSYVETCKLLAMQNLVKDLDAKISDIQYNSLNLPIMITFTDGSTTRYTYDATVTQTLNGGPKRTEEEYEAKARRTEEQYRKELK